MEYSSIDEIYDANSKIRERLRSTVADLPMEVTDARPEGEKWSIAEIMEHIAKVNNGSLRICERLLQKASGVETAVNVKMSENFRQKAGEIASMKVEAPEIVRPTGARSVNESLDDLTALEAKYLELKPLFEKFDGASATFPHPFFGDLNAHEWLALSGGHEARHLKQIEKLIDLIGE